MNKQTKKNTKVRNPLFKKNNLKIIPLGGLGEIGKNMMAIEYGDDIIVIDAGLMFPQEEMLGIDFVIPNISYLEQNRNKIRALIITHGHEDHTGAIPYVFQKIPIQIYTAKLTAALIEAKFKELGMADPNIKLVAPGHELQFGIFKIKLFGLSHTIPDELGLVIDTPVGRLVYMVDFRFDKNDPKDKEIYEGLLKIGRSKVRLLFLDSTNAEVEGQSVSEVKIKDSIGSIIKNASGRVIVTSFASSLPRIQSVFDAAIKYKRKIAISGRSMQNTVDIALKLGYLKAPKGLLINIRKIHNHTKNEIIVLCTGSQGEEYAALVRIAAGEHKFFKAEPGDTVIISASAIPGNERAIAKTIDNLFREGAEVIYGGESADVHASGHAKGEDLKLMMRTIHPEYFIPIHGEFRQLVKNAKLAQSQGIDPKKIFVIENGEVVEFDKKGAQKSKQKVSSGYVLVDGLGIGDVGNIVLRDRHAMATEGIFVVILTIDAKTGRVLTSPDIISRGFVYMRESEDLINKTRKEALKALEKERNTNYPVNWTYVKNKIRDDLGDFLYKHTQRRPMIIPVIIEV